MTNSLTSSPRPHLGREVEVVPQVQGPGVRPSLDALPTGLGHLEGIQEADAPLLKGIGRAQVHVVLQHHPAAGLVRAEVRAGGGLEVDLQGGSGVSPC